MAYLEKVVTESGGIALRYGGFYADPEDPLLDAVRAGKFSRRERRRDVVVRPPQRCGPCDRARARS